MLPSLSCLLYSVHARSLFFFFFFNDTATTEIYTLSLHDALPISSAARLGRRVFAGSRRERRPEDDGRDRRDHPRRPQDRKSTRLNSSHANISYAVFCLKKKKNKKQQRINQTHTEIDQ